MEGLIKIGPLLLVVDTEVNISLSKRANVFGKYIEEAHASQGSCSLWLP